jgi:AcrR family transcriptional regulator
MKQTIGNAPARRDPDHTRQAIVQSAIALLVKGGKPASLDAVAAAAGVSKGGVLHHFSSQDELAAAMCLDSAARVRESVLSLITDDDAYPGRLLRAYVRALLGESSEAAAALMHFAALMVFKDVEGARTILGEDAQLWRDAFADDGIEPDVWLTVRFAAEGIVPCLGTPYLTDGELDLLRKNLLALTETAR